VFVSGVKLVVVSATAGRDHWAIFKLRYGKKGPHRISVKIRRGGRVGECERKLRELRRNAEKPAAKILKTSRKNKLKKKDKAWTTSPLGKRGEQKNGRSLRTGGSSQFE